MRNEQPEEPKLATAKANGDMSACSKACNCPDRVTRTTDIAWVRPSATGPTTTGTQTVTITKCVNCESETCLGAGRGQNAAIGVCLIIVGLLILLTVWWRRRNAKGESYD